MTAHAARWVLAAAMAKYSQGSRLLQTYGKVLDADSRKKIEDTRNDFKTVIAAATKRLLGEARA